MKTETIPNKPSSESARPQTSARWYLWDGGFLALGRSEGVIPAHAHHAIQIAIALDGTVAIQPEDGDWKSGRGVIVRPDVVHSYNGQGAMGAMYAA